VHSPLLTDLYQLTMAYGYWQANLHERDAVFQLVFRQHPFGGNYAISCGLASVIEVIEHFSFQETDLAYLASLKTPQNQPLFPRQFLDYLKTLKITCDIDAMPEGTVVFANEPLLRVQGPLLQAQLLESILLNLINFQTLIATKAARIVAIAKEDEVLEFGLRRAQGPDGALSASRAAFIGGCTATSNVLAGKLYDIPVRGTHSHSWVSAFDNELAAFEHFAQSYPGNCVLLVDTYDTLAGVKNAMIVGHQLRARGYDLQGVRLDSGDLDTLSKAVRHMLDDQGFQQTKIVVSNSLDETTMRTLKAAHAPIDIWGVGTNLVTAYDSPALDGVYKLSAIKNESGAWDYKLKLSEQTIKVSTPGIYQVRRFFAGDVMVGDILYDKQFGIADEPDAVDFAHAAQSFKLPVHSDMQDLLIPIYRAGRCVFARESIHDMRARAKVQRQKFSATYADQPYHLGIELKLSEIKQQLISAFMQAK